MLPESKTVCTSVYAFLCSFVYVCVSACAQSKSQRKLLLYSIPLWHPTVWVHCHWVYVPVCVCERDTDWRYFVCVLFCLFSRTGCIYFGLPVLSKVKWMLSKWVSLGCVERILVSGYSWVLANLRYIHSVIRVICWLRCHWCPTADVSAKKHFCLFNGAPCHILYAQTVSCFCVTCCLVTIMMLCYFPQLIVQSFYPLATHWLQHLELLSCEVNHILLCGFSHFKGRGTKKSKYHRIVKMALSRTFTGKS